MDLDCKHGSWQQGPGLQVAEDVGLDTPSGFIDSA
jgi:hypothetical protein